MQNAGYGMVPFWTSCFCLVLPLFPSILHPNQPIAFLSNTFNSHFAKLSAYFQKQLFSLLCMILSDSNPLSEPLLCLPLSRTSDLLFDLDSGFWVVRVDVHYIFSTATMQFYVHLPLDSIRLAQASTSSTTYCTWRELSLILNFREA